jgi:ubiquinone/menaquinone biosynthesis C-methylase UbiE
MLTMLLDDKLFLAPISRNPGKVLDVGTGTGIWAMYSFLS